MLTELISSLNEARFLPEFTFTEQKIKVSGGEIEFADCAVVLDSKVAIFQLKERENQSVKHVQDEEKWFVKKLKTTAKQQMKKSIEFFNYQENITIKNLREHPIDIKAGSCSEIYKVIIYKHDAYTALDLKHYLSQDIGFIHIIDSVDYKLLCRTLMSPSEIFEYLEFREDLIQNEKIQKPITEKSILGVYLQFPTVENLIAEFGAEDADSIVVDLEDNVNNLKSDGKSNIYYILESLYEKIYLNSGNSTDYYKVCQEIVKLNRSERRPFKERWLKYYQHTFKNGELIRPSRMISMSKTGFIFISIEEKDFDSRFNALINLTGLSKYEQKLDKHVGIVFCKNNGQLYADYCYIEGAWEFNEEFENILQSSNPFKPLAENVHYRYEFNN